MSQILSLGVPVIQLHHVLKPEQKGLHNNFKSTFSEENSDTLIQIAPKFVPKGKTDK